MNNATPASKHTAELLTVPEVMARMRLGRSKVYDLIRSKRLVSITVGRSRRVPTAALSAFIAGMIEEVA
jgi:excisionase family DNA binding protein